MFHIEIPTSQIPIGWMKTVENDIYYYYYENNIIVIKIIYIYKFNCLLTINFNATPTEIKKKLNFTYAKKI